MMNIQNITIRPYLSGDVKYVIVGGNCLFTGKHYSIVLNEQEFNRLNQGEQVQDVVPHIHYLEREFLISGISPEGLAVYITQTANDRSFQTFEELQEKKNDSHRFIQYLRNCGIDKLYHFTDKQNIESITQNTSILSNKALLFMNISPVYSSSELSRIIDLARGYDDYIRLSFLRHHPMMWQAVKERSVKPVVLEIALEVLEFKHTLFTIENAVKSGVVIDGSLEHLKKIRFDCINVEFPVTDDQRRYRQAEVMVRQAIPLKYVLSISEVP
jgi:hypothetical protein